MDATMLAVFGTGLTAIGATIALFTALWRVQGNRFDALERHVDKQLGAVDKRSTERFEMAEKASRERFEMAETTSRERFEMAEKASRERFEMAETTSRECFAAMERRFEAIERQSQATHAAVCALNGRFDDLYRHLLAAPPRGGRPDPAAE